MKTIIKEFLAFSNTEKRGILVLFSIILILQIIRFAWPYFDKKMHQFSQEELLLANSWMQKMEQLKVQEDLEKNNFKLRTFPTCFSFDPNTLKEKEWIKLGFTEKESKSIIKFRNKGGKFEYKEDLKKLYCINEEVYNQLAKCVVLPERRNSISSNYVNFKSSKKIIKLIEINAADTIDLLALRGVGKYWAKKIWFFKERLGGIYSEEQLNEIKGMNDSMFYNLQSQIRIDTSLIIKIPLNSCTPEELQKHPYCWYGVGKAIANYRLKHGNFKSLNEIQNIYAVKPEIFEKLRHYFVLK
jgi:DNA uptake protein ComE-like DNA-binding protein